MAKVDTNSVSLSHARETAHGTKRTGSGVYTALEPNEISSFGSTIVATPREPISNKLQRQKGSITDLDAAVGFSADLTIDGFLDWIETALFAARRNKDVWRLKATGADDTNGQEGYTASGKQLLATGNRNIDGRDYAAAATLAKFALVSAGNMTLAPLVWGSGFENAGNNGLKALSAAPSGHATNAVLIPMADGTITASETGSSAYFSLAGARLIQTTGTPAWTVTGGVAVATLTADVVTQLKKVLTVGQTVHIGSVASVDGALQNGVKPAAAGTPYFGFCRVRAFGTDTIDFDRLDAALQTSGVVAKTSATTLDIIFGDFLENVPDDDAFYADIAHSIELASPDLITDGATAYEYARGCQVGSLALTFPLNGKATFAAEFIATDVDAAGADRAEQADAGPANPVLKEAFNTTADFARLRVMDHDEDGLDTDFKSVTLTINPQLSAEKVLGKLGAKYINRGNLLVDVEAEAIFSSAAVPDAIRKNATMFFDMIVGNDDGVLAFDIPSMTLGGGARSYPANAAVLISTAGASFEDATFENSLMVSIFDVPLPTA